MKKLREIRREKEQTERQGERELSRLHLFATVQIRSEIVTVFHRFVLLPIATWQTDCCHARFDMHTLQNRQTISFKTGQTAIFNAFWLFS